MSINANNKPLAKSINRTYSFYIGLPENMEANKVKENIEKMKQLILEGENLKNVSVNCIPLKENKCNIFIYDNTETAVNSIFSAEDRNNTSYLNLLNASGDETDYWKGKFEHLIDVECETNARMSSCQFKGGFDGGKICLTSEFLKPTEKEKKEENVKSTTLIGGGLTYQVFGANYK